MGGPREVFVDAAVSGRLMGTRVVVADDHALVREGVAGLIDAAADLEVVGTAHDLAGLLAVVEELRPDVVVTDIRMPPTGTDEGISAAAELRERHPAIGVVVLSMFADPAYVRALLGDGTDGRAYLLKSRVQATDELIAAVRTVAAGGSVVDPTVVEALLSPTRAERPRELDRLTAREREVLAVMATGASNSTIAARLAVSSKTVETHVGSRAVPRRTPRRTTRSAARAAVAAVTAVVPATSAWAAGSSMIISGLRPQ